MTDRVWPMVRIECGETRMEIATNGRHDDEGMVSIHLYAGEKIVQWNTRGDTSIEEFARTLEAALKFLEPYRQKAEEMQP